MKSMTMDIWCRVWEMRVTGSIKPNKSKPNRKMPFILGVAGGSGSGKTFFAQALQKQLNLELRSEDGSDCCALVYQDNFYIDQSKNFDFDGGSVNFDHPSSIDFPLLAEHLAQLKTGVAVQIPIYDFVTHSRKSETIPIEPRPVIIVDGILIFHADRVRMQFDDLVFFDTPEDLRFQRRLERDVQERGREPEGVRNQFFRQVKPMHDQFVEPSKAFAKTIVKDTGQFGGILQHYCESLKKRIRA
jgi:uridine kinase